MCSVSMMFLLITKKYFIKSSSLQKTESLHLHLKVDAKFNTFYTVMKHISASVNVDISTKIYRPMSSKDLLMKD